jgi:hypothetical protein
MNTFNEPATQAPTGQKMEGETTQAIEERTARVPSGAYLALAIGSMAVSASLMLAGKKQLANFVGQWAPALLIMGLYNKVVKVEHELLATRGSAGLITP